MIRRAAVGGALALGVGLGAPSAAVAADGVYGRFDGDVEVDVALGAAVGPATPSALVGVRALYLATAGIYGLGTESFGGADDGRARSLALGLVLRPAFLARYARNWERGPARLDLFVDSVGLEFGAVWSAALADGYAYRPRPGYEFALGAAFPLTGEADGLHLGLRAGFRLEDRDLEGHGRPLGEGFLVAATLEWRSFLVGHVVDARDRVRR